MELNEIKAGEAVGYFTPTIGASGGTVMDIKHGKTGAWVTISDGNRRKFVSVRPSEVYATPRAAKAAEKRAA